MSYVTAQVVLIVLRATVTILSTRKTVKKVFVLNQHHCVQILDASDYWFKEQKVEQFFLHLAVKRNARISMLKTAAKIQQN